MQFANINGHTIHYKHIHNSLLEGANVTFVFINSLGTDFRIWSEVVESMKPYGNILLFDKRGHGLSDVVENTNGLNDFADDVIALLQYLSIKKYIPIGLSVGGMIAQILANRTPGRIEKLILCDTRFKIGSAEMWNERIAAVREGGISAISDGVMQRWFSEKFRNENAVKVSGYKNMLEQTPTLGYIKTIEAIRDADLTEIAKQIKLPSLCVVGSEDKSTLPEEVKNLADLIGGAEFEVIAGSGHIPCVDNPRELSKLIIQFIRSW
jgi:3-oxoadipate enol-lactonase